MIIIEKYRQLLIYLHIIVYIFLMSVQRLKLMLQTHTDIPVQEEYQLALYVTIDVHKK